MTSVCVLVPVLGRPHRAGPTAESIRASDDRASVLFLCSPGDRDEIAAVKATGESLLVVPWPNGPGDYARKMNLGFDVASSRHEWVFLGADDLVFHPGWFDACLRQHKRSEYACVIGTNDLGNQRTIKGSHSTHTLVHRDYLGCGGVVDEPGKLFHEGYSHNYCNPPEAPIWMADCTFRALGDVEVGDVVVGWERIEAEADGVGTPRRALCYSEVLASARREAPLVRVVMESGREFRCTPDHRWLNAAWSPSSSHDANFVTPSVGRSLLHVVDEPEPVRPDLERLGGWLAGIYDGEGSGIYLATQSTLHNPEVVEAIADALRALEVRHSMHVRGSGIAEFVLTGGRQGYLDFLLRIAPVRREALSAHVLGWRTRESSRRDRAPIGARRFGHRDRIVAVEPITEAAEVVSLTTSSGNYVAWGYASRNCDDEFIQTAQARRTYSHARDAIVEHLHPNWRKGAEDETYRLGMERFQEDRILFERRRRYLLEPLWRGR